MKTLPFLLILIAACSRTSPFDEYVNLTPEVVVNDPEPDVDGYHTIVASKSYGPSVFNSGTLNFSNVRNFEIPQSIAVTSGNAGNHNARIDFVLDSTTISCLYKGGASVSRPLTGTDTTQINLGKKYNFLSCGGRSVGDSVGANKLTVTVLNGDTSMTTEVEAKISEI